MCRARDFHQGDGGDNQADVLTSVRLCATFDWFIRIPEQQEFNKYGKLEHVLYPVNRLSFFLGFRIHQFLPPLRAQ